MTTLRFSIRNLMLIILIIAVWMAALRTRSKVGQLQTCLQSWKTSRELWDQNTRWLPPNDRLQFGPLYGTSETLDNHNAYWTREIWIFVPDDQDYDIQLRRLDVAAEQLSSDLIRIPISPGVHLLRWDLDNYKLYPDQPLALWIDDREVFSGSVHFGAKVFAFSGMKYSAETDRQIRVFADNFWLDQPNGTVQKHRTLEIIELRLASASGGEQ